MMGTVWVLCWEYYDGGGACGVFDSEEKAKTEMEERESGGALCSFYIEEYEVK